MIKLFNEEDMPETIRLLVELARPDVVEVVWWEQLDTLGYYFRVKTTKHKWLVKQEGRDIRCWRFQ